MVLAQFDSFVFKNMTIVSLHLKKFPKYYTCIHPSASIEGFPKHFSLVMIMLFVSVGLGISLSKLAQFHTFIMFKNMTIV